MYKNLILLLTTMSVLTFTAVNAQDKPDSRLLSKFSKKELKTMDAESLNYWTFYVENSFEIVDIPKEKGAEAVSQTISLNSMDKKDINVFKLGLNPHEYARDYYRIEGTDKMLMVLPHTEIDQKFKANK